MANKQTDIEGEEEDVLDPSAGAAPIDKLWTSSKSSTIDCGAHVLQSLNHYLPFNPPPSPLVLAPGTHWATTDKSIALRIVSCDLDTGVVYGYIKEQVMHSNGMQPVEDFFSADIKHLHPNVTDADVELPNTFVIQLFKGVAGHSVPAYQLRVELAPVGRPVRRFSNAVVERPLQQSPRSVSMPAMAIRPVRRNTMNATLTTGRSWAEIVRGQKKPVSPAEQDKGKANRPTTIDLSAVSKNIEILDEEFPVPQSPPASPHLSSASLCDDGIRMQSSPSFTRRRRLSSTPSIYQGAFSSAAMTITHKAGSAVEHQVRLAFRGVISRAHWEDDRSQGQTLAADTSASYCVL